MGNELVPFYLHNSMVLSHGTHFKTLNFALLFEVTCIWQSIFPHLYCWGKINFDLCKHGSQFSLLRIVLKLHVTLLHWIKWVPLHSLPACCDVTFVNLVPTSSYFSEGNYSVSFPERCSVWEGLGFEVLCVRSPGVKEICGNGLLCTMRIRLVARAWGF